MNKPVIVVEYNPEWPQNYNKEATCIKNALGNNLITIHHIGSTSVPGLAAKPKIDILAEVQDTSATIQPLEGIGYQYRGDWHIPFKYGFAKRGHLIVNLHVMPRNNPEIELNLKFRDYLRDDEREMSQYAKLKHKILRAEDAHQKHHPIFNNYTLRKSSFIKEVLRKAGFNRIRLMFASTEEEWQAISSMCDEYLTKQQFENDTGAMPFGQNQKHFILYKGVDTRQK